MLVSVLLDVLKSEDVMMLGGDCPEFVQNKANSLHIPSF